MPTASETERLRALAMQHAGHTSIETAIEWRMDCSPDVVIGLLDRIDALERDRDEWRTQHDNAIASWRTDVANLGKAIDESRAASGVKEWASDIKMAAKWAQHAARVDAINLDLSAEALDLRQQVERLTVELDTLRSHHDLAAGELEVMRKERDALAKAHPVMLTLLAWIADEASAQELRDMAIRYSDENDGLSVWLDEHRRKHAMTDIDVKRVRAEVALSEDLKYTECNYGYDALVLMHRSVARDLAHDVVSLLAEVARLTKGQEGLADAWLAEQKRADEGAAEVERLRAQLDAATSIGRDLVAIGLDLVNGHKPSISTSEMIRSRADLLAAIRAVVTGESK